MVFEKIDRAAWDREEYFQYYFSHVPCTYSMTVKLDITALKKPSPKAIPHHALLPDNRRQPSSRVPNSTQ